MVVIPRLSIETAREYAFRVIKENIINLELEPGSMVSENEISSQLGLSRTPVRESLIELSRVNIVEILPQKGSRVSLIDYSLVEESRFLRFVLESAVIKELCSRSYDINLSVLEENMYLQEFYLSSADTQKLLNLDNAFHEELFKLAKKNQCYKWLMEGINIHFDRVRQMSLNSVKDIKIVNDHKELVEAIKFKEAKKGLEIIETHLSRYKIDENVIRAKYPNYFL